MRQLLLAAGACAVIGFAGQATAQGPSMPGQVVGTGYGFGPVGQQVPKAASPVGRPINIPDDNPLMRRYDPSRPYDVFNGTNIDPRNVAAPVSGSGDQSVLDRLYEKMKAAVGYGRPVVGADPNVTPGIFRRNRARSDSVMWRRD